MNGTSTTGAYRRGALLRGCLGALLVMAGGILLAYARLTSEFLVTVTADQLSPFSVVGAAESPQSPMEDDWLVMFDVRSPDAVWVEEMTVPEPSVVRGITIGALVRFDTGEVRMLQKLEGADYCPT